MVKEKKEKKGKSVRFAYNEETGGPVTDSRDSVRWIEDLWGAPGAGEEEWAQKECGCSQGKCRCETEEWEWEMKELADAEWEVRREMIQQLMLEKINAEYGGEEVTEEAAAEEEVVEKVVEEVVEQVVEQAVEEMERLSINEGDAGEEEDGGGEKQKPADDLDRVFADFMAGKFADESDDEDEGYGGGGCKRGQRWGGWSSGGCRGRGWSSGG